MLAPSKSSRDGRLDHRGSRRFVQSPSVDDHRRRPGHPEAMSCTDVAIHGGELRAVVETCKEATRIWNRSTHRKRAPRNHANRSLIAVEHLSQLDKSVLIGGAFGGDRGCARLGMFAIEWKMMVDDRDIGRMPRSHGTQRVREIATIPALKILEHDNRDFRRRGADTVSALFVRLPIRYAFRRTGSMPAIASRLRDGRDDDHYERGNGNDPRGDGSRRIQAPRTVYHIY
jgi:hypothetical protein